MFKDKKAQTAIEIIIVTAFVIIIVTVIGLYLKKKTIEIGSKGTKDLNNVLEQAGGKR